jgi:hypothetical protein
LVSVPLVLENGVDSTLAGMIIAQVSDDVYDAGAPCVRDSARLQGDR